MFWNKKKNNSSKRTVGQILDERQQYLENEKPFILINLGTRQAPMKPSDIQFVSMVMAFAWKYAGMQPQDALEFSITTFVLKRNGTEEEKRNAQITSDGAFAWSMDNSKQDSMGNMSLQMSCAQMIKKYLKVA